MKRTKLQDRILPCYCKGEEIMNMVTHIVGGVLAVLVLMLSVLKAAAHDAAAVAGCSIYGISMIAVYTVSSIYHGLRPGIAKKVMQIIDHCAIYFLIAGTYTPILLVAFVPDAPVIGWGLLAVQWGLLAIATTLTAIDLRKYRVFSMICYITMGWSIIFFLPLTLSLIETAGFILLLAGGIAYTIGAILFGLGKKLQWMHAVFHIFVILGSLLQFLCIYLYIL